MLRGSKTSHCHSWQLTNNRANLLWILKHEVSLISITVKLGYNDHGYNEFMAITNKYSSTFLVPNGTLTT